MPNYIAREVEKLADDLGIDRKRSIGEVAKELKVKTHVIRFWEENFPQVKPEIGAGKRRYYYNKQVRILKTIKKFLYEDGYTIAGLQKILRRKKSSNEALNELEAIALLMPQDNSNEIEANAKKIELEDFLPENDLPPQVASEDLPTKIDSHSRLFDFSDIKLSTIDPSLKKKIHHHTTKIHLLLNELKALRIK